MGTLIRAQALSSDCMISGTQQDNPEAHHPQNFQVHHSSRWRQPRHDICKFNTDAAWKKDRDMNSIAGIARDSIGRVFTGYARQTTAPTPLIAEALAMILACSLHWKKVVFESDSLKVIQACGKEKDYGEIWTVIQDIQLLRRSFDHCGFTWTHRSGNEAAHQVAALFQRGLLPTNWIHFPPTPLWKVLRLDSSPAQAADYKWHPLAHEPFPVSLV
ncbi:uncharacterized protein LOC130730992 [Lotus japonicus]|uniref:uncharacterized protein LOC130730992 n=1 Tax=Lotus japonicus TaxID=34305 RepID=UPI00258BC4D8|nr:uncharacterized protein LOC130730992 [Lotus japonicus]